METATAAVAAGDSNNVHAVENINTAISYNTDAQSVQSGATFGTHGTISHSPVRTAVTPLSLSPVSHNKNSNINIPDTTMGAMEVISHYGQQQQQQQGDLLLGGMRQVEWQVLNQQQQQQQQQQREQQQQQQQQALNNTYQQNRQRSNPASEDDQTEQSSSANTRENNTSTTANNNNNSATAKGYTRSDSNTGATSTFGRLVKSAAKSINNRTPAATNTDRKQSADEEGVIEGVLIYGYLQKLNRNGKWQTRWFETDGQSLTYFKSSKRVKLLASLDLAKVGSIVVNKQDVENDGCCFTISISKRPYHLKADSKTAMKDWVITLNRVKEARMQEGNVKLVMPKDFHKNRSQSNHNQYPIDLLDDQNFNTPLVVVVSNRQRTHAVEDDAFHSWEAIGGMDENNPFKDDIDSNSTSIGATTSMHTSMSIARWQKPKHSIAHIAGKVLRWARSLRQYHCSADAENQVIILNHNYDLDSSTENEPASTIGIAATQSGVSTTTTPQSPKNNAINSINVAAVNTVQVPTADLLHTDGVMMPIPSSIVPSNNNQKNAGGHQQQAVVVEDDDDENAARFLS